MNRFCICVITTQEDQEETIEIVLLIHFMFSHVLCYGSFIQGSFCAAPSSDIW